MYASYLIFKNIPILSEAGFSPGKSLVLSGEVPSEPAVMYHGRPLLVMYQGQPLGNVTSF